MHDIPHSARAVAGAIALLLLATTACAPLPAGGPPAPAPPGPGPAPGGRGWPIGELESRTFAAVNDHRNAVGLRPLAHDPRLSVIARAHSREMANGAVGFGHDGFSRRAAQVLDGKTRSFAENIAKSTRPDGQIAEATLRGWLASAVHRKNIDGRYTASGVGVARDQRGTTYITQVFIGN